MAKISKNDGTSQNNFSGQPNTRATSTAKYVQSFDEISIRTEQPATTDGYVPRGNPAREPKQSALGEPKLQQHFDERQNARAQPQTFFRDTPQSAKDKQDKRPDRLYKYTSEAGEDL